MLMVNFAVPFDDLLASFASAFTQQGRLLSLRLGDSAAWAERLLPQEAEGDESLSANYRIRVRCVSPQAGIPLKELLGQVARVGILASTGGETVRCGVVTAVRSLGADGGLAGYELQLEPPLALLRHRHRSRVFQDRSVPEIVAAVLAEHGQASPVFAACSGLREELGRRYPPRSYCVQYRESDLDFVERLLSEEGIAWRFEHDGGTDEAGRSEGGRDGGGEAVPRVVLVLFDDPHAVPPAQPGQVRFHRAEGVEVMDGLTAWRGARSVGSGRSEIASFDYKPVTTSRAAVDTATEQGAQTAAIEAALEDYEAQTLYYAADPAELAHYAELRQQVHDRGKKRFHGEGNLRMLVAGQWFALEGHPEHDGDPPEERQFVVTRLHFRARNNLPAGPLAALAAAALTVVDRAPDEGEAAPFTMDFEAVRRGVPLASAFARGAHARPLSRGPQTATVVGPAQEEIHTDEYGRIRIQFHWQRQADHPDGGADLDDRSSCWLRVAYPSAGRQWGHQFIPRVGQEVLVDFLDGDIDRPLVVGVIGNGSHPPPAFSGSGQLPANKALSGIKSQEIQGTGFNELLFDDTAGQLRTRLSSEHAATQLNLGYLTHPRSDGRAEPRGEGAELRSDGAIALRAAHGLLLSTYAREGARDTQLARSELLDLLEQCRQACQSLADYAAQHQALAGDVAPLAELAQAIRDWDQGSNVSQQAQGGGQPAICLTAPAGVALATPQSIASYAGINQDLAASQHLQLTAGELASINAGAGISLFAQSGDVRSIAHQGQYLMQAQHGDLVAEAERNLRVSATSGEVVVSAPTIRLIAEDGSFIRIGGGITLGTEGAVQVRAARQSLSGPATESVDLPTFDKAGVDQRFVLLYPSRDPAQQQVASGRRYEITLKDGRVVSGVSDAEGRTELLVGDAMQLARIRVFDT